MTAILAHAKNIPQRRWERFRDLSAKAARLSAS